MQSAAIRGIPVMETLKAGERAPPKSVWLNSWGEGVAWSCLLTQEDAENVVTARALTSALDQWADGAPIRWSPPKARGRDQMPLLFFTSRQVGNDIHTVRANRLKADLVLYLEVKPGP